jgi:hypothetical protein
MPTDETDWNRLTLEAQNEIMEGALAMRRIRQNEDYQHWAQVGRALARLRNEAMRLSGSNSPYGRTYQGVYRHLAARVPDLGDLDNASRAHSVWLAEKFEAVDRWHKTLAVNERMRLNHPSAIKRRYEAAHVVAAKQPPRPGLKQEVARLQTELDDASARANAKGEQGDLFNWTEGHLKIGRTLAQDGIRNASIRKVRSVLKAAMAELDRIEAKTRG